MFFKIILFKYTQKVFWDRR